MNSYIIELVLSFTSSGKDYKNFIFVNKQWYTTLNTLFPKGSRFVNHLTTLLKLFPDENWDYSVISQNPNMYINTQTCSYISIADNVCRLIINNKEIPHNMLFISRNPNVTWDIVTNNPELDWDFNAISRNCNINMDIVKNNKQNWNYTNLSRNRSITLDDVINNPGLWSFDAMSENPTICNTDNWERLSNFTNWNYVKMLVCGDLELDIIMNNMGKFHNYDLWWFNNNFRFEQIAKIEKTGYRLRSYEHDSISTNINITMNIVNENPSIEWNYSYLVQNKSIAWNDVINHPKLYSNASRFSTNPNLTWEIVLNNKSIDWDFKVISGNEFTRYDPHKSYELMDI